MSDKIGTKLPEASFIFMGKEGPEAISIGEMSKGKKIAIFALPGAFTPTCSNEHLPGYVKNAEKIRAKGIDAIYCVSVNDVFVLKAWADQAGADEAGIRVVGDGDSSFTRAMGMDFDGPPAGLYGRSKRYSLIAEDGVIKAFEAEETPGQCTITSADHMLGILG